MEGGVGMGPPHKPCLPCRIAASGWLVFLLAMAALFWLCRLLKVLRGLLAYWDIRRFYGEALRIPAVSGTEGMAVGRQCRCRGVGSIAVLSVPRRCRSRRGAGAVGTPVPCRCWCRDTRAVACRCQSEDAGAVGVWCHGGGAGAVAMLAVTTGAPVPWGYQCHGGGVGAAGVLVAVWGQQGCGGGAGATGMPMAQSWCQCHGPAGVTGCWCQCGDMGSIAGAVAAPGLTEGLRCQGGVSALVVPVPCGWQCQCGDISATVAVPVPMWGHRCRGGAGSHGNVPRSPQ